MESIESIKKMNKFYKIILLTMLALFLVGITTAGTVINSDSITGLTNLSVDNITVNYLSGFTQWGYDINSHGLNIWNGTQNIAGYSYLIAFNPLNSSEMIAINGVTGAIDYTGTMYDLAGAFSNGGTVIFTDGIFPLDHRINVTSNSIIKGSGNTTLREQSPLSYDIIDIVDVSDVQILDLIIDSDFPNQTTGNIAGTRIINSSNVTVQNVKYIKQEGVSLYILNSSNLIIDNIGMYSQDTSGYNTNNYDGIHLLDSNHVIISNIRGDTEDDFIAIGSINSRGTHNITVSNVVGRSDAALIKIGASNSSSGTHDIAINNIVDTGDSLKTIHIESLKADVQCERMVLNNIISRSIVAGYRSPGGNGIYINNANSIILSNSVIHDANGTSIYIKDSWKVSLINNIINNSLDWSGIRIYGNSSEDISILNNHITTGSGYGIWLGDVVQTIHNITVANNHINCPYVGMELRGVHIDNTIHDNHISPCLNTIEYVSYTGTNTYIYQNVGKNPFYFGIFAAAPTPYGAGDEYYNSTDNKKYCYNGSAWNALY